MAIITRSSKGSPLTHAEMDNNLVELRDIPEGKVFPKTKGVGIKLDTDSPTWGWHDMLAHGFIDPSSVHQPTFQPFKGGITEFQFAENDEMLARFHIPHDYLPGSDIFIHVHYSHNSDFVTGGDLTWSWETTYSKGHNQAAFHDTITTSVVQSVSTIPYQHMIAETSLSTSGGAADKLNSDIIEVDGVILCRFFLNSNDIIVSGGGVPNPFVHYVDIHYQSTGIPTKQRSPDFWT